MDQVGIRRYYINDLEMSAEVFIDLKNNDSNENYFTRWICSENEINDMCKEELFRFFTKQPETHLVYKILEEMIIYWILSLINNYSVNDIEMKVYKWINDEEYEEVRSSLSRFNWGDIKSININSANYNIRDILIEESPKSSEHTFCITGDTHGDLDFKVFYAAIKSGYRNIFICGDFGYVWDGSFKEQKRLNYLSNIGINIYFVCGNHENFNLLYNYPIVEINGGKAHKIRDNIYHLIRGEIFTFGDKKVFVFGGATSIDKHLRNEGKSWWPQEIPTEAEKNNARNNLDKYSNKVNYIITHTGYNEVLDDMKGNYIHDEVSDFLSEIYNTVQFDWWFFGHMHINYTYSEGKSTCINKLILNIDL